MKKTVLITGCSGDIGKAIAKVFIQNNYIVIGTYYKNKECIDILSDELGENFHYYKCNLSDFNQAGLLLKNIKSDGLSVDILINNAGISQIGLIQDTTKDEWENIWNTNVTSAVSLSGGIVPLFLEKGCGKIINISSVWGNTGASCEVCYSTTKGAINTFTKALAQELAPSNIQVNAISCGIIDTKMNSHLSPDDINEIIEEIPAGRIGTPQDIADAVFALSNAGSYLTGQIITVDGGWQL